MRQIIPALTVLCLVSAPAMAQDQAASDAASAGDTASSDGGQTMAGLIDKGYEIKAAVPSGTDKLIIFLQNEKSAYACEFVNLTKTRCGSIN